MKKTLYYLNKDNNCSPLIPSRFTNYLEKNKFLSEFNTEEAKQQVRDNLGISDLLLILKQIIDAKVIEAGGVGWDTLPIEGHTENALSSDALYRTFANYILSSEVERLLDELSSDYNEKIENIQKDLNFIPKNRGEYTEGERYYEGNLVQYKGGTYITHPEDYDIDTNPLAYVTIPPFNLDPEVLNPGWGVFARGYNAETSGGVTNVAWDDNSKSIVQVIKGEVSNVVTADKLKEEIGGVNINYNKVKETLLID